MAQVGLHHTVSDLSVHQQQIDTTVNAVHQLAQTDAVSHFTAGLYQALAGVNREAVRSDMSCISISLLVLGAQLKQDLRVYRAGEFPVDELPLQVSAVELLDGLRHDPTLGQSLHDGIAHSAPSLIDLISASASQADVGSAAATFGQLGTALGHHLATLKVLDPAAVDSLVGSLATVIDAVESTLEAEAVPSVHHNVMVLSTMLGQLNAAAIGEASASALQEATAMTLQALHAANAAKPSSLGACPCPRVVLMALARSSASICCCVSETNCTAAVRCMPPMCPQSKNPLES